MSNQQQPGWFFPLIPNISQIQNSGGGLPQRQVINFTGVGVTATDDPVNGRTNVAIVGGGIAPTQGNVALTNGTNSNVAISSTTSIRFGGYTAAVALGGMNITPTPTAGVPFDVQFIQGGYAVTIKNNDPAATNPGTIPILTGTGVDALLPPGGQLTARFILDATLNKYILQNTAVDSDPVVYVKNFGAQGNNSANDGPAIQAAINYLGSGSGRIRFSAGVFLTNQEIVIPQSGIWLEGQGNPFGTSAATFIKANAAIRSVINNANQANQISDITILANRLANFGVLRNNDCFSEYRRVGALNALIDGFHEQAAADGTGTIAATTISSVTHTGSGTPALPTVRLWPGTSVVNAANGTGTTTVKVTTGGALGAAQVEVSFNGGSYATPPITIPSNGQLQFVNGTVAQGILWTFAAGTYVVNDTYQITVTVGSNVNDFPMFRNCSAQSNGNVYCTNNVTNMAGAAQFGIVGWGLTTAVVSGTLTMTAASAILTGVGTSFTATGARAGDFIRAGFPTWAVSTAYKATLLTGTVTPTNNSASVTTSVSQVGVVVPGQFLTFASQTCAYQVLSVASGAITLTTPFTGTSGASATTVNSFVTIPIQTPTNLAVSPGPVVVWKCTTAGTSGSTAPAWPIQLGANVGVPPIGLTVTDGTAVWTCWAVTTFKILSVQDDNDIIIGGNVTPAQSIAGCDFGIAVGSGWFDEISVDTSQGSWHSGSAVGNAAAGISSMASYGLKCLSSQATLNGIAGFSIGAPSQGCRGVSLDILYVEGNLVSDYWLDCTSSVLTACLISMNNASIFCNDAFRYGVQLGDNGSSSLVFQPIGSSTYGTVPVISTQTGQNFALNGPQVDLAPVQFVSATTTIESTYPTVIVAATGTPETLLTSTPNVQAGVSGQRLRIINDYGSGSGFGRLTLQSAQNLTSSGLLLEQQTVTLDAQEAIDLQFIGGSWVQVGHKTFIAQVTNALGASGLTTGNNNNFAISQVRQVEIAVGLVAGAFTFTGFIGGIATANSGASEAQPLRIVNYCLQAMTLAHLSGSSSAANQIICPNAVNLVLAAPPSGGMVYVDLVYSRLANGGSGAWLVTDYSGSNGQQVASNSATQALASTTPVTLTAAQYAEPVIVLTGTLTTGVTVVFPNQPGLWYVDCSGLTTTGQTLTFKSGTATAVAATVTAADSLYVVLTRGGNTIAIST